jgi:dTDP-4-dehydrorhamnose 3,5-epimerase
MRFVSTEIDGVYVLEIEPKADHRGFFARAFCQEEFRRHGLEPEMLQLNVGFSHRRGTLRGVHYQRAPHGEAKLVRCTRGAVFDVAVDLRPGSPTLKRWVGVDLSADNHRMLYIPEGCAHGYQTLEDESEIYYMTSRAYVAGAATGVRYSDPQLGIRWPLPVSCISEADAAWADFAAPGVIP